MAQPPPASLAHIPVDASKTEPIAAFYKLQFGDELTGFAYYMRTLVVTIGRNVVPHSNTPPPVITTPNVPSIPPLDTQSHSGGTPSIRNLSLHNAALASAHVDVKPQLGLATEVKLEPTDMVMPAEMVVDESEASNDPGSGVVVPEVTVLPPGDLDTGMYTNEQALEALAAFATPSPQSEIPLPVSPVDQSLAAVPASASPVDVGALEPMAATAASVSPSQSHLPLIRDILDGPPPPPPPKSQPPAEPVDVDLGALKSVSRFHAKIEYCADRSQFCLEIHGRNGAWVDGRFFVKGCKVPLEQGSQIQIATRIFSFVLPPSSDGTPDASPVLPQDDYSYPHHLHYHHAAYQDFFGDAGPSTIAARIPPRFNAFANGDFGIGADGAEGGDYVYGWDSEDEDVDSRDSDSSNSWASDDDDMASQIKQRASAKSRNGSGAKGKQKLRQALFDDDSDLSSLSSEDGDGMDEDHDEEEVRALSSAESSYSEAVPNSHRKRDRKHTGSHVKASDRPAGVRGASSDEEDDDGSEIPLVVAAGRKDKKAKAPTKKAENVSKSHKAGAGKGHIAKKTSSPEKHRAKEAAVKTAQSTSKSKSKKSKSAKNADTEAATAEVTPATEPHEPQHAGKRPKGGKWAAKSVTPALVSDSEGGVKNEDSAVVTALNPTPKKEKKDKKKKDKAAKITEASAPIFALPTTPSMEKTAQAPADDLPPTLAAAVAIQQASAVDSAKEKKNAPVQADGLVRRPSATAPAAGTGNGIKSEDHPPAAVAPAPPLTLASVAAAAVRPGPANHPPQLNLPSSVHHTAPPPAEKPKPPPPPPFQHLTELIDTPGRPGHIIVNVPIPPSGAGPRPPPAPIVGLDGKPFIGPDPQKPTLTFATIIHRALLHLPRGRGTLGEVCNWVAGEWEYFRLNPEAGWQNSIRHNLSLNKAFLKVARIPSDDPESKGSVWIIDPEEGPLFEEKQRRDAEKSEGKMKNAEVKAERERQRAELKAKKAKDKDYIGKDGLPLKPGDPKIRMMAPAGSIPRPNLVRPVGAGPNGAGPILAKGKITVVVQPVTPALRARSSLLSKDANGDLLPFVLDGATLILDQQTFLHLNRDIIEKLEHLGAAGAIEVLSAWVVNRNRQAAAKAAAAAAAANRATPGAAGTSAAATVLPKVGSAPLAPRPLGQQTAGAKPGGAASRPASATTAAARPPASGAARPLPGPAAPGETLIKVIGMIAEVAAVRGDVNIVGPNASALLTYIKAVGIDIDMPTAERVWATGVVPPLTGRPPASRPGPIGRTSAPAAGTPRQTIGGSSGVVPSANRPPAPLGKYGPAGRPAATQKATATPAVRPVNGTPVVRPPVPGGLPKAAPSLGGTGVATVSPTPPAGSLPAPASAAASVSPAPLVTSPSVSTNPLKRKAEPPLSIDASLSDYSSLIGVGSMPMDEDGGLNGGDAKKARV